MHIWHTRSMHSQINFANAGNPGGHVIGQLYEITHRANELSFSSLRYQNIDHKEGDTMLVLDVRVTKAYHGWKDVEVLINGRLAQFKTWAFQDLIDAQSIKLVK